MARLLKNLETIRTMPTMLNEQILIKRLTKGTLIFQPTPSDLETLRKAGASEELIKLIGRKAGLPEPPPQQIGAASPPSPKQGRLTVTCKPVECRVSVNQKEIGVTAKGELKDYSVMAGPATVSALAKNYIPDKQGQAVQIQDNGSAQVGFIFTLDPAALIEKGNALFAAMESALGGEAGLKEAGFFSASGRLDVHDKENKTEIWPFSLVANYPIRAKFTIKKNNKTYEILNTDSGFLWKPKQPGQEFNDLEDGLRYLLDYHISQLMDRLRGSDFGVEAEKLNYAPGEDAVLKITHDTYKYRVTLNAESRPREIGFESVGLNSGIKVLLSDYAQQGTAFLPKTMEVELPGSGMRGIIVRYETMTLNPPGVKDDDFKPKKGYSNRSR